MTEQIAHLSERALDQSRGVLVPHVVPVQVDVAEPLLALGWVRSWPLAAIVEGRG